MSARGVLGDVAWRTEFRISNDSCAVGRPWVCQPCWTLPVLRTFAPLWEVFRVSSDKLALCHLELTRKLHDLLKDVLRYGEEQLKAHKKVAGPSGRHAGARGLQLRSVERSPEEHA